MRSPVASAEASPRRPVLVMGAGAIGCFIGGMLAAAGHEVHFVGRPRVLDALRRHGLRLSDLDGRAAHLEPSRLHLHESVPLDLHPAITLLCVKSGATVTAALALQAALLPGSVVVSLQNGIGNAERARAAAPELEFRAGMVPFNVAELAPGHYHRGSTGVLMTQQEPAMDALAAALARQGLGLKQLQDLRPVQWGKLLLNLNNPVNALSGLPLRGELLQRGYRLCLAALQAEALQLLQRADVPVARVAPLPARWLPALLRLPTPIFRLLAARMLRIDAKARSSMADDLALGRVTEIDMLCGEVLRLAQGMGRSAPLNARMLALVQAWPQRREPYAPAELQLALGIS